VLAYRHGCPSSEVQTAAGMFGMSAHAVRAKTSIQVVLEVHLRRRGHESQTHIYTPAFAAPANVRICHFGVNVAIQHE
jgi:hypothetical protein